MRRTRHLTMFTLVVIGLSTAALSGSNEPVQRAQKWWHLHLWFPSIMTLVVVGRSAALSHSRAPGRQPARAEILRELY